MGEIGERLAEALATKDGAALLDLLDPDLDFRGLTPNRFWEASDAKAFVDDILLGSWLQEHDHALGLEGVETAMVVDRPSVAYRFRVRNDDGTFLIEQQAYYRVNDGRIDWLRIMCSGFRRLDADQT